MAKGTKTGGRRKGSINKSRAKIIEGAKQGGEMPLDYMLRVMRDPTADDSRRDEMAKSASPYFHSKMPTALVTPPAPTAVISEDDESLLNQYLHGLHDEADQD
ncbi:hypothetical protein TA3x_000454 [Tundrisphaera sp. TA3]|uniref:hypothetical protein n=1 Tax=Tundrisphaera sp. TA3 TaxID=3435775 RepID=UPI003EB76A3D